MSFDKQRRQIAFWARHLNRKGFVAARSGNLSLRVDHDKVLITSHDSYLGFLEKNEVLLTDLDANVLEGDLSPAVEKDLHLGIYKSFDDVRAVIHSHSPLTTAYFHYFTSLNTFSFESRFYLGALQVVPQYTPTVTDIAPVISALEKSSIVVLQNHGVVSMGKDFKEAYGLMELLEEQAKVNFMIRSSQIPAETQSEKSALLSEDKVLKRHKLLSEDHVRYLMELVNNDREAQELGKRHGLSCTLAVKIQDTGKVARFHYVEGSITGVDNDQDAEFLITGKEDLLKMIFNGEIDPFVASTQGKVKTQGDFAKMSRWYPALLRTFKLWENAPVE